MINANRTVAIPARSGLDRSPSSNAFFYASAHDGDDRGFKHRSFISAMRRWGVIGRRVMAPLCCNASSTAFAIAAPTPLMPPSPAPLRPSGLTGDGTSSVITTLTFGRLVNRRHQVIRKCDRQRITRIGIDEFFVKCAADALQTAADDLAFHEHGVDRTSHFLDHNVAFDRDCTGSRRPPPTRYAHRMRMPAYRCCTSPLRSGPDRGLPEWTIQGPCGARSRRAKSMHRSCRAL